ncbi:MAG: NUDIX domain-containing protein [Candidatus Moranbacteria bacterium]|nr:NUDIX domain-containing protein [Candidatus Moranbacteria bacterium]
MAPINKIAKKVYATYNVAMKILLKRGEKYLFLIDSPGNKYDLPGGRIDDDEHLVPLEKILEREVKEELGSDLRYKLGNPIFQFRRYIKNKNIYVFITVYLAEYLSGGIKLSSEHSEYKWIDVKKFKFKEKDFWRKEEYVAFKKYFG